MELSFNEAMGRYPAKSSAPSQSDRAVELVVVLLMTTFFLTSRNIYPVVLATRHIYSDISTVLSSYLSCMTPVRNLVFGALPLT